MDQELRRVVSVNVSRASELAVWKKDVEQDEKETKGHFLSI